MFTHENFTQCELKDADVDWLPRVARTQREVFFNRGRGERGWWVVVDVVEDVWKHGFPQYGPFDSEETVLLWVTWIKLGAGF